MLNQFRLHYPQGSLISELVRIDHGLYIVRSLVQVEGVTLATGLAAATTIEAAENQARLRALDLLHLDATSSAIAKTQPETPQEPIPSVTEAVQAQPVPPPPAPVEKKIATKAAKPKPEPVIAPPVEEIPPVIETPSLPEPVIVAEVSEPEVPELVLSEPVTEDPEPEPILSFATETVDQNGKLPLMDLAQTNGATELSLSLEEPSLPLMELDTPPAPVEPTPTPPLDLSGPIDFSEVIARSNVELKRLNWTNEQGKNYLLQTYGKRSRQLLSDEELLEFLQYLESLPTPPLN
ncbi:MAG: hypothetical protein VKJ02_10760 [Snowella sp.]|nr:hypothetical protein [Snowella sp.]